MPGIKRSEIHRDERSRVFRRRLSVESLEDRHVLACALADSTPLIANGSVDGAIVSVGDSACFSFEAAESETYDFDVVSGTLASPVLKLLHTDGVSELVVDRFLRDTGPPATWRTPVAGTYFLEVRDLGDDNTGTFAVAIESSEDDHGNGWETATPVNFPQGNNGTIFTAARSSYQEVDFFSFTANAGTLYNFEVSAQPMDRPAVSIYDQDTRLEWSASIGTAVLLWNAPADETYYVEVSNWHDLRPNSYHLHVSEVRYDDDHGNDVATATLIAMPSTTTGEIEVPGDRDLFAFEALAGVHYVFDFASGGTTIDLELRDGDGEYLTLANGQSSPVPWITPATDTYYVELSGQSNSATGNYSFNVTELPTDDYGNIPLHATPIGPVGSMPTQRWWGAVHDGDVDFFSFEATAGSIYKIVSSAAAEMSIYDFETDSYSSLVSGRWRATADGRVGIGIFDRQNARVFYELEVTVEDYVDDHSNLRINPTSIAIPSRTDGTIEVFGDVDYFSFEAIAGASYDIRLGAGSLANGSWQVYDPAFDPVGIPAYKSYIRTGVLAPTDLRTFTAAETGTYSIVVTGFSGKGSYALHVESSIDDYSNRVVDAELVAIGQETMASIDYADDIDVFAYAMEAGAIYNIRLQQDTLARSSVRLHDTDGTTELAFDFPHFSSGGTGTLVSFIPDQSGTYFIEVESYGIHPFVGSYFISVSTKSDEEANDAAGATVVPLSLEITGEIDYQNDRDIFAFDATQGQVYVFSGNGSLHVLDTDGITVLADNVDEWFAPKSGRFFVEVLLGDWRGSYLGSYSFEITRVTYDDDHGNVPDDATDVKLNSSIDGVTEIEADVDFFAFEAVAGSIISLRIDSGSMSHRLLDTDAVTPLTWLDFDRVNNVVFSSWSVPVSGTYFFELSYSSPFFQNGARYSLQIGLLTVVDDHGMDTSSSTEVMLSQPAQGRIDFLGDDDYFSFHAIAGRLYNFEVHEPGASKQPHFRTKLSLFDADDGELASTSLDSATRDLITWAPVETGTYYLLVQAEFRQPPFQDRNAYTVTVESPMDDHGNLASDATLLTPSESLGEVEYVGDSDFFSFNAVAGTVYHVEASTYLFDFVLVDSDGVTELAKGQYSDRKLILDWLAPDDETYFLVVNATSRTSLGAYSLTLSPTPYSDDHGNVASMASPLLLPSSSTGQIELFSDKDFYSFEAVAGRSYLIRSIRGCPGCEFLKTEVRLYDTDGSAVLAVNEGAFVSILYASSYQSIIEWTAPTSDTYFVEVRSRGKSPFVGGYTLSVTANFQCDLVDVGDGCDIHDLNHLFDSTVGSGERLDDQQIVDWLESASHPENPLKENASDVYVVGDANLDGNVDATDLGLLLNSFADESGLPWGSGNFNTDVKVDSSDLGLLLNNYGYNSLLAPPSQALLAFADDAHQDAQFNRRDLGSLINNFGRAADSDKIWGDLDGDHSVDSQDLGLLLNAFGSSASALAHVNPLPFPAPATVSQDGHAISRREINENDEGATECVFSRYSAFQVESLDWVSKRTRRHVHKR